MPTALFIGPYRFSFYSADCIEPRHMHVWRDDNKAKWWLDPIMLAYNDGFSRRELTRIERLIEEHVDVLRSKWDEHCASATG